MAFYINDYFYLYFWSATINALIFWEFLRLFNAAGRPLRVTQSHWANKCVRILPLTGRWTELTHALRQVAFGHRGYPPFTYRGLVEFLVVAEEALDSLGDDSSARQQAAHQLVYVGLMEPAKHIVMPDSLEGRIRFEHREMDALGEITPTMRQCRRVAAFWYYWVDARGIEYPRGIEGTWKRIWELVTTVHGIEYASPSYMAQLLAPPPPPPIGEVLAPQPLAIVGYSSESSNSVNGPDHPEDEE